MRGRKRIFSFIAVLSAVLVVSMVFASGIVHVPKLLSSEPAVEPLSPGPTDVSMDPRKIIDKTKVAGSLVTFEINVTGVSDLFTWQINVTWGKDTVKGYDMLNVSRILPRTFLGATTNTSSEVLGFVINVTDNAKRYSAMAETILGSVAGVTGTGDLVAIEFRVLNYGTVDITIIVSGGTLPTTLLDSAGSSLPFSIVNGVFRNIKPGDADHDGDVDWDDFLALRASYLKSPGAGYNRESDTDLDGDVDWDDFLVLRANYLK